MKKEEFFFDSRDGESKIHAVKWIPDEKPVCIVQIVHGMEEYVERYESFAKYLTDRNMLVVGEDHLGHGKSMGNNPAGYFCEKDAATVVVRDVHRLKKMMQETYPGVPYYIFGHSMGSFISRNYITKYGTGIDGIVLSGTGMPAKPLMHILGIVAGIVKCFYGAKYRSKFIKKMAFGAYNNKVENPINEYAWLSVNEENSIQYENDPLCGFGFTVNGYQTLKNLCLRLHDKTLLEKIPKTLPVFFVYGAEDPVGEYGKAVQKVYHSYQEMGIKDVSIKEYVNARHEILNEKDGEVAMEDVYQWIASHIHEETPAK